MRKKLMLTIVGLLSSVPALAEGTDEAVAAVAGSGDTGLIAISAAIAIAVAALGGALAQAKIGASAMEGLARNPQAKDSMFIPMILGLVLIESLVIYALVIAFLLSQKV